MNFIFRFACVFSVVIGLTVFASAQTATKKKTKPKTTPNIVQTSQIYEPEVISRADQEPEKTDIVTPTNKEPKKTKQNSNSTESDDQIRQLSTQVRDLTQKINSMEAQQRALLNLEMLSRAEARAENIRKELMEITEKETALKTKLDQLEFDLRPDVIEKQTALYGSTRPEEIRELRRKALEEEKKRAKEQLQQLADSRTRLEQSVKRADVLVEKLRQKVENDVDLDESDSSKSTENVVTKDN
jgi:chromosome segregation ATPase